MNCHYFVLLFVFLGQEIFLIKTQADGSNCSVSSLNGCPEGEACSQISSNSTHGACICLDDTVRSSSGICLPKEQHYSQDFSSGVSASAIAVGLLVPAISVVIIGALVLIGRRYRWISRFRDQAHQLTVRNYDNVLVGNEEEQTG